jgi:hypothetical protein
LTLANRIAALTISCSGSTFRLLACAASAAVALGAGLVLLAWALDIEGAMNILPALPKMMPNTALGLLLAAASLWLLRVERPQSSLQRLQRSAGRLSALAVTLLGLLTLVEYLSGWDLGIDQLLFRDPLGALTSSIPGPVLRPKPPWPSPLWAPPCCFWT